MRKGLSSLGQTIVTCYYVIFYSALPGYVENFTIISISATSITLSWNEPPQDQQNGVITGYIINFLALDDYSTFNLTTTSTSLTVNTLEPYHTYVCIIAAETAAGTGPFGSQLFILTHEARKDYVCVEDKLC